MEKDRNTEKENLKTVMKRKYDLIFIDTESSKFKLENNESFIEKIKMLNKNSVLIYMYYSKKPIFYNDKYEKVLFNNQIFIVYKEENLILTDKIGYPQFYTQLVFEKDNPIIKIKTVINNVEGTTKISTCENIEVYESKI